MAQIASPLPTQITPVVDEMYPSVETLYNDLHSYPEIAFQEVRTAARMADELRKLGLEVTVKIGGIRVVAIYKNGAGPTMMVRTELDALPMEEKTGLPYASKARFCTAATSLRSSWPAPATVMRLRAMAQR